MLKSGGEVENFEWAQALGCYPSSCSGYVQTKLIHGIHGLLWDDVAKAIHPSTTVIETRKNLLLDDLKNSFERPKINQIRNGKNLLKVRNSLASKLPAVEMNCKDKELSINRKASKLAAIQQLKSSIMTKIKLLDLRYHEMENQMKDCKEMRSVCNELLPLRQSVINEDAMNESLSLVGIISSRLDKKEAWKKIHENLGSLGIPELWEWVLKKRIQDGEELFRLWTPEDSIVRTKDSNQRLEVRIAEAYGKHVNSTLRRFIDSELVKKHRERGLCYVQKILDGGTNEDLSDWLVLAVEIPQLIKKRSIFQAEIHKLQNFSEEVYIMSDQLHKLESDIHSVDALTEQNVQKLHTSLAFLESAVQFLLKLKQKLLMSLETMTILHSEHRITPSWTNINLSMELAVFHENLDINAFKRTILSGNIGAYRYATTCISYAPILTRIASSGTPIFRVPSLHLVDCFQTLVVNSFLKKRRIDNESTIRVYAKNQYSFQSFTRQNEIVKTLEEVLMNCTKCHQEIEFFNSTHDSWCYQDVHKAISIYDRTVHGMTFNDWIQRFTAVLYIIQRNK